MAKKNTTIDARPAREFLADYLPFLLNRLTREMLRGVDQKFQERGLTVATWRVLAVLADRGTCRFGELAALTSMEPATLSRFVASLISDGLVRRRRSTSDARAVRITLTEVGEAKFNETLPWGLDVENKLVRGISTEDIEKLKAMLKVMFGNIDTGLLNSDEASNVSVNTANS